jgi:Putative beta-barrel porin-2, OmpL-like. bbp2
MFRTLRLPLAGLLLAPALTLAQAPIVPVDAPVIPKSTLPISAVPQPMPRDLPAVPAPKMMPINTQSAPLTPAPAPVAAPAVTMPEPAPAASCDKPEEEKKEEERFLIEKALGKTCHGQKLLDNGWRIYGWTQGSYTTGSGDRSNLPVPFIDRNNEFSMMQNWLHVEKTIDTSKKEFQVGGVVDAILPGTDSRFTLARGLFDQQNRDGRLYGFDLFQAYADIFLPDFGANGTTMRVGKFATFLEYEVVQGISNPFLSRSYLFQYNPFTHTGVNFLTQLNDNWSMQNGVVLGADNFIDPAVRTTYIGQLKYAPKDGDTTVAFGTMITRPDYNSYEEFAFYNVYNLQVTHKFNDKLNYVLDASFSHIDKAPGLGHANWFGVVQYLSYALTDKVTTNFRTELFNDTNGFRTGTETLYSGTTLGLTWKPTPWLYIMPEARYDYATKGSPFAGKRDLFTASIGSIIRW